MVCQTTEKVIRWNCRDNSQRLFWIRVSSIILTCTSNWVIEIYLKLGLGDRSKFSNNGIFTNCLSLHKKMKHFPQNLKFLSSAKLREHCSMVICAMRYIGLKNDNKNITILTWMGNHMTKQMPINFKQFCRAAMFNYWINMTHKFQVCSSDAASAIPS